MDNRSGTAARRAWSSPCWARFEQSTSSILRYVLSEYRALSLIRKHIEDPNHEITDEDIRNIKPAVSNDPPGVGAEAMARLEEREEEEQEEDDSDVDEPLADSGSDKPATPWDVRE